MNDRGMKELDARFKDEIKELVKERNEIETYVRRVIAKVEESFKEQVRCRESDDAKFASVATMSAKIESLFEETAVSKKRAEENKKRAEKINKHLEEAGKTVDAQHTSQRNR